jgi:hypothetical protein
MNLSYLASTLERSVLTSNPKNRTSFSKENMFHKAVTDK